MDQNKLQDRLASLKSEFEAGQTRLRQLEGEQSYLRETLLRISGAIQVLQELTGNEQGELDPQPNHPDPGASLLANAPSVPSQ